MKKRVIALMLTSLFLISFNTLTVTANIKKDKCNFAYNQDITGKVIVIDPGHSSEPKSGSEPSAPNSSARKSKDIPGATGNYSKKHEHDINMQVAQQLKAQLELKGFTVIMTKDSVEKSLSNIERAEIGNQAQASLVIRIHCDHIDNGGISGAVMLVPGNNKYTSGIHEKSKEYGKIIIDEYCNQVKLKNRGITVRDDLTGFNWSQVPTVLIELGFLSNSGDDYFISSEKNHELMAKAIADGIGKCFEN